MAEPYEPFIEHLIDFMQARLYLHEWRITFEFKGEQPAGQQAESHVSADYLESEITFNKDFVEKTYNEKNGEYLMNLVAHELSHCLTAALQHVANKNAAPAEIPYITHINEMLTQRIANIVCQDVTQDVYKIEEATANEQG